MIWSLPCLSWLFPRVLALFLVDHPLSSTSLPVFLPSDGYWSRIVCLSSYPGIVDACLWVWQLLVIACLQGLWSSVGVVERGRCSNDSLLCDIHKPAAVWSTVLSIHPQSQKSFCPDSLPRCSTQLLCSVALPSFPRQDSPVNIIAVASASLQNAGFWNQLFSVAETIGVLSLFMGSVVKSNCCSFRAPKFDSQHLNRAVCNSSFG